MWVQKCSSKVRTFYLGPLGGAESITIIAWALRPRFQELVFSAADSANSASNSHYAQQLSLSTSAWCSHSGVTLVTVLSPTQLCSHCAMPILTALLMLLSFSLCSHSHHCALALVTVISLWSLPWVKLRIMHLTLI